MFTTLLSELSGYFDRNWVLSIFFPSLAFWSGCLFVAAFVRGLAQSLQLWQSQSLEIQFALLAGALAWIILFAFLLGNFQTAIIRLFEGYWRRWPLSVLREYRLDYYRRRFRYLKASLKSHNESVRPQARAALIASGNAKERKSALKESRTLSQIEREHLLFLPRREEHVMPTQLGNIIRSAEVYPYDRYRIDAVVIWPRLHAVLPAEFINSLVAAKTTMVFMLMMSVLSFAFAIVACLPLALLTSRPGLFFICALGVPLSWVCYQNALHGASSYGESIKTAFDLHRWKLLEALHLKLPTDPDDEKEIWDDVTTLIYRSTPLATASYDRVQPPPPAKETTLTDVLSRVEAFFEVAPTQSPLATAGAPAGNARPVTALQRLTTDQRQTREDNEARRREERDSRTPPKSTFFGVSTFLYLAFVGSVTFWLNGKPQPQVTIAVASRDLPAYHLLTDEDVTLTPRAAAAVPSGAMTNKNEMLDQYTLEAVSKNGIIQQDKIKKVTAPASLNNMFAVPLPATPAMVLGGSLKAGDVVDVTVVPNTPTRSTPSPSPAPTEPQTRVVPMWITFRDILVLDVKSTAATSQTASEATHPFVLIIALPAQFRDDLVQHIGSANIHVTRRP